MCIVYSLYTLFARRGSFSVGSRSCMSNELSLGTNFLNDSEGRLPMFVCLLLNLAL